MSNNSEHSDCPAGEIEKFVKRYSGDYIFGSVGGRDIYREAKALLTAQAKRCEQLEAKVCNDVKCPNRQKENKE